LLQAQAQRKPSTTAVEVMAAVTVEVGTLAGATLVVVVASDLASSVA
jgi:hypothetical protein